MNKSFTFFLILSFCYFHSLAQNPLIKQWDKRFGGSSWDIITGFKHTSDGGYIMGGYTDSGLSGDKTQSSWGGTDFWVVKTDALGNKIWDKRFGGSGFDTFYDCAETSDGGFILGGVSSSGISGDKTEAAWSNSTDIWIVKINSSGSKEWDKRFGGTSTDYLSAIQQTSDGGYMLAGYSNSGIGGDKTEAAWSGSTDFWVVKTDANGIKQWDKRFGGSSTDYLVCMQQTTDGGYILGGWSGSGISGDKTQSSQGFDDYWIVKINSSGVKQWDKRFGGTQSEEMHSLDQTSDGGYILGGASGSAINGDKTQASQGIWDYWIVKTDANGVKQWDKRFGGSGWDHLVHTTSQTPDGGYVIAGISDSDEGGDKTEDNSLGIKQGWVVKADASGNKVWDITVLTNGYDRGAYATVVDDTSFAFAIESDGGIGGYKTQTNQGSDDYWLVKFSDPTAVVILPIELIDFNAMPEEKSILLSWSTASEINNKELELQRSLETIDEFETIYSTPGHGNSMQINYYSYTDYNVNSNVTYYYRLKQIDYDGKETYSAVIDAEIKDDDALMSINPNPFTESLEINYTTDRLSNVSIELFNSMGGKVATIIAGDQEAGEYSSILDAKQLNLDAGIYILHLRIDDMLYAQRIVKSEN